MTELLTTPSTFVWSVAVDKSGTAYVGTASPATVLRVGTDGKPFTLFETKDLSVQVVRLGPDGALYAATLPSGKVYRLNPDATTKQDEASADGGFRRRQIRRSRDGPGRDEIRRWKSRNKVALHLGYDLRHSRAAVHRHRRAGAIYRVDPQLRPGSQKAPELFFKSDEAAHSRAGLGREGKPDRRLRRFRAGLPHQP